MVFSPNLNSLKYEKENNTNRQYNQVKGTEHKPDQMMMGRCHMHREGIIIMWDMGAILQCI